MKSSATTDCQEIPLVERFLDRARDAGRDARANGYPCSPPYESDQMQVQWVRGWHEIDRETEAVSTDTNIAATCATQGHLWGPLGTCVMCGHPAPPPSVRLVSGVGRDAECDQALVIFCSRRPTDDEMRAIHDAAREACR